MAVEILHDEPAFAVVASRNLLLALWRDAPQPEWFRILRETAWPYGERHPRSGWINLIVSGTPTFSEEARREATELTKRHDIFNLGTAHIVLLPGLKGSATRAFLSTIFLLARSRTPTKVFASVDDAAEWLAPKLGADWSANEVVELCSMAQADLGLVSTR